MNPVKHQKAAVSKPRTCATDGCKRPVEREPPCEFCEECCYDQIGDEIEKRPIGAVYGTDGPRGGGD